MASQLGEKLILRTILEGFVTGHGFSRAANASFSVRALAPEAFFCDQIALMRPVVP
jgi:hypothetical protein